MKNLRKIAQPTDNRIFATIHHPYVVEPSNIAAVNNSVIESKILGSNEKSSEKNVVVNPDEDEFSPEEKELHTTLTNDHRKNNENLNDKEKIRHYNSLRDYSENSFPLNSYHWEGPKRWKGRYGGGAYPEDFDHMKNETKNMDDVLKNHKTTKDITVYSGTFHNPKKRKNQEGIVRHPAYLSTSISKHVGKMFAEIHEDKGHSHILQIHVPAGSHGVYAGGLEFNNEREFILPRNTKMRYLNTETEHKSYEGKPYKFHTHHMEVIGDKKMNEAYYDNPASKYANIEVQDASGTWQLFTKTFNDSRYILPAMKSMKAANPDKRVRAVDDDGRLLDMLL